MKELKLIDRVVVEIRGDEGFSLMPGQLKNMLQFIAYKIADEGRKGQCFMDSYGDDEPKFEVLFEHECTEFGFRMGDDSLIHKAYYETCDDPRLTPQQRKELGYD